MPSKKTPPPAAPAVEKTKSAPVKPAPVPEPALLWLQHGRFKVQHAHGPESLAEKKGTALCGAFSDRLKKPEDSLYPKCSICFMRSKLE